MESRYALATVLMFSIFLWLVIQRDMSKPEYKAKDFNFTDTLKIETGSLMDLQMSLVSLAKLCGVKKCKKPEPATVVIYTYCGSHPKKVKCKYYIDLRRSKYLKLRFFLYKGHICRVSLLNAYDCPLELRSYRYAQDTLRFERDNLGFSHFTARVDVRWKDGEIHWNYK